MSTVIRTDLATVLLAVRTHLVAFLSWDPTRVLVVPPEKLTAPPHYDSYLWLWKAQDSLDYPRFQGAGRFDRRATVRLEVGIRSRLGTDEVSEAVDWLADPTGTGLGHLQLWLRVCDAMDCFIPDDVGDGTGNWLVTQPIVPAGGGRPRIDPREIDWGESVLAYDVSFALALNQAVQ